MIEYPTIFKVVSKGDKGQKLSSLVLVKDAKAGDVLVNIEGTSEGPKKYSTVQLSETMHCELNSELLYMVIKLLIN